MCGLLKTTNTARRGTTTRAAIARVASMANMTMNIPTRVSDSGAITVWNHATSVSCTLETSEVRRVTVSA